MLRATRQRAAAVIVAAVGAVMVAGAGAVLMDVTRTVGVPVAAVEAARYAVDRVAPWRA